MGLQHGYNEYTGKYYIRGFMFGMEFDTEQEMKNAIPDATERHFKNLESFRIVHNMLISYRH